MNSSGSFPWSPLLKLVDILILYSFYSFTLQFLSISETKYTFKMLLNKLGHTVRIWWDIQREPVKEVQGVLQALLWVF